ncbi:MAG: acyltransferase family protein [Clostridiales bacterium]|nr:acyltransferase family protein [Clostridiales bacterium]
MFTRNDTKIIKGMTILLMLAHHLFLFPERYPAGFGFDSPVWTDEVAAITVIGRFGKICVSMFMFLGGYGLWCQREKASLLSHSIIKLYKAYWKVLLIFIPIGFLFFSNQISYCEEEAITQIFSNFNLKKLASNIMGWEATYNREWWFFREYLCMLFLGYFYMKSVPRFGFGRESFLVIVLMILGKDFFPGIISLDALAGLEANIWFSRLFLFEESSGCFFLGIVFARYNGIEIMREAFHVFRTGVRKVLALAGIISMVYIRYYILGSELDVFYVPCLIVFFLELLDGVPFLPNIFSILGQNSTNMWLTHTFFCYYFYPFVQLTHVSSNPWIDLTILTVLSLGASVLLDGFYKIAGKVTRPLIYAKGV